MTPERTTVAHGDHGSSSKPPRATSADDVDFWEVLLGRAEDPESTRLLPPRKKVRVRQAVRELLATGCLGGAPYCVDAMPWRCCLPRQVPGRGGARYWVDAVPWRCYLPQRVPCRGGAPYCVDAMPWRCCQPQQVRCRGCHKHDGDRNTTDTEANKTETETDKGQDKESDRPEPDKKECNGPTDTAKEKDTFFVSHALRRIMPDHSPDDVRVPPARPSADLIHTGTHDALTLLKKPRYANGRNGGSPARGHRRRCLVCTARRPHLDHGRDRHRTATVTKRKTARQGLPQKLLLFVVAMRCCGWCPTTVCVVVRVPPAHAHRGPFTHGHTRRSPAILKNYSMQVAEMAVPRHAGIAGDLWFAPHDVHNEMLGTRLHVHTINTRVAYDTVELLAPVRPAVVLPAVPLYAADLRRLCDFLFLVVVADAVRLYTRDLGLGRPAPLFGCLGAERRPASACPGANEEIASARMFPR